MAVLSRCKDDAITRLKYEASFKMDYKERRSHARGVYYYLIRDTSSVGTAWSKGDSTK